MSNLFIVGSTDLSEQINFKSAYKVNAVKKYSKIENANGVEYRNNYRTKVNGSFDMWFVTGEGVEFSNFLTLLSTNSTNNVLLCTVYVQNTGTTATINCFCDVKIKKERIVNNKTVRIATITVQEC